MMTTFSIYANASAQDTQGETKQRDLKEAGSETRLAFAHEDLRIVRCDAAQRFPPSEQVSAQRNQTLLAEEPSKSCKYKCHNPTSAYTNRCTLGVQNYSWPSA